MFFSFKSMGFISAISTKIKINRIPPRINLIMKSLIDSISLAASGHIFLKKVTIKKKQNFKFLKNPLFFHNISKMTTDTYKSVRIKNLGIFLTNNLVFLFFLSNKNWRRYDCLKSAWQRNHSLSSAL